MLKNVKFPISVQFFAHKTKVNSKKIALVLICAHFSAMFHNKLRINKQCLPATQLKSHPKVLHFRLFFPTEAGRRPHNFLRMFLPLSLSTHLQNNPGQSLKKHRDNVVLHNKLILLG
jgi:hypothetical protein